MQNPELLPRDTAALPRWLSIVGIGEDGIDGLSPVARGLVEAAEIVFGGRRQLSLAAPLIRGASRPWPSPFDGAPAEVLRHRGRRVCVLASGDPFHYGVGAVLARHIDAREMVVLPTASAFSLAAARLGWSLQRTVLLSLHGRMLDLVRPHLQPASDILALTSDGDAPAALARLLTESGFGASRLTVLEALGGPRERIRATTAADSNSAQRMRSMSSRSKSQRHRRTRSGTDARPRRQSVRARRPDHQARNPRGNAVIAFAAPRRAVVGHRCRLRLGRDRMDARRSDDARDYDRATRRSRRAHPPQRGGIRRARARYYRRRGAGCLVGPGNAASHLRRRRRWRSGHARCSGAGAAARRPARGQCGDVGDRGAAARPPRCARWRIDPNRDFARGCGG